MNVPISYSLIELLRYHLYVARYLFAAAFLACLVHDVFRNQFITTYTASSVTKKISIR